MGGFCKHFLCSVIRTASLGIAPSLILSEVGDHEVGISLAQKLKGDVEISHAFQPIVPHLLLFEYAQVIGEDAHHASHLHSADGGAVAPLLGGNADMSVTLPQLALNQLNHPRHV